MDCYEKMIIKANELGIEVIEKEFKSSAKGLCKGNKIGISKSINTKVEKRCVLAEEIAHSVYTVGDILDLNNPFALKQELYARRIAYEYLISLDNLIEAYLINQYDTHCIASYLEVTDSFLHETLKHYEKKYGKIKRHGKYLICFSPFNICEIHNMQNNCISNCG